MKTEEINVMKTEDLPLPLSLLLPLSSLLSGRHYLIRWGKHFCSCITTPVRLPVFSDCNIQSDIRSYVLGKKVWYLFTSGWLCLCQDLPSELKRSNVHLLWAQAWVLFKVSLKRQVTSSFSKWQDAQQIFTLWCLASLLFYCFSLLRLWYNLRFH